MRISDWSSDVCSSDLDVPSRHVRIFAQVAVQFSHEGLAESHDFAIRAAARIEIGPALAAADRQPGQRILEDLFETKEFNDAKVDGGVKSDAPLIWAEGGI